MRRVCVVFPGKTAGTMLIVCEEILLSRASCFRREALVQQVERVVAVIHEVNAGHGWANGQAE
jgi:hypothetical protein